MKMQWTMLLVAALGLILTQLHPAVAAECFCLAHPVSGEITYYGCEARLIPKHTTELKQNSEYVSCLSAKHDAIEPVENAASFSRILKGEGSCNPCAPEPVEDGLDDTVRDIIPVQTQ